MKIEDESVPCPVCGSDANLYDYSGRLKWYCPACKKQGSGRGTAISGSYVRKPRPKKLLAPTPCAICGTDFTPAQGGQRYCSRECRNKRGETRQPVKKPCISCGSDFWTRRPNRAKSCPSCCHGKYARSQQSEIRTCTCGSTFQTLRSSGRWQCRWCEEILKDDPQPCAWCGKGRTSRQGSYCSRTCSTKAALDKAGERVNDLYRLACSLDMGGFYWRQNLYAVLIERDGPNCQLCGEWVDLTIKSGPKGDRAGPSIDHILPRSLEGPDDLANLRLAHWGCNRDRMTEVTQADVDALQRNVEVA